MTPEKVTLSLMVICAAVLIGWDLTVAFFNRVPNHVDTISGISAKASMQWWGLPYAAGVVLGHLFLPGVVFRSVTWWGMAIIFAAGAALTAGGFMLSDWEGASRKRVVLRALPSICLGIAMGHMFWPQ